MENLTEEIQSFWKGDIADDNETLTKYSHDASVVEVRPSLVLFPKDTEDLKELVRFVDGKKGKNPGLSITGRSAGTDMTGGPLTESLVLDFTRYFNHQEVNKEALAALVQPGVFFRDLEAHTFPYHIGLPVYPASKQLAALGGMVMNNAGGEKTLRYGQVADFVEEVSMVLSDGNEYTFKKCTRTELVALMEREDFLGHVYREMWKLIQKNQSLIESHAPKTTKNSAGYALWDVWDKRADTFDLTRVIAGSQGTLGLMTRAKMRLVKEATDRTLVTLFLRNWNQLPEIVNRLLPIHPESMEVFDDTTMKIGIRFMPEIAKSAHQALWHFALRFLPEVWIGMKMFRMPKLVVLVEFAEFSPDSVTRKVELLKEAVKGMSIQKRIITDQEDRDKYWVMRRESFNLLRKHVRGKQTAPFIDDFAIDPAKMPEFLPKLLAILKENGIGANIAGHAGDGNYHIIPLMDLTKEEERAKIVPVAKEVYELIVKYGGTITAEHNDGIVRTPFVKDMFGAEMYSLFEEVKKIFDPQNIFNPGKKVGGSLEFYTSHIKKG